MAVLTVTKMTTKKALRNIFAMFTLSLIMVLGFIGLAEPQEEEVIATLNGDPITLSEAQENVAFQVYRLRGDIYYLLKRETEQIVNQKLLSAEAARRGLTVNELLQKEVDDKLPPLDEKEVDNYLAEHPKDAGKRPQKRNRIRTYLSQKARSQRKLDFLASLREKADFKFHLNLPQRPRTKIDTKGEPWRGNPEAPVTLIHFASFTCKLCAKSTKMIKKMMDEHPNKIKWVHRNYFRINDENALTAAQMGEAAYEQGRFWDFHDRMFAFEGQFEVDDIAQVTRDSGLSQAYYEAGEQEGRFLLKVREDLRAASRSGVTTVPVIFVNGFYFSSTFPYEQLKTLVDRELDRFADSSNSRKKTSPSNPGGT
jgi:protein-disulfide isomerase